MGSFEIKGEGRRFAALLGSIGFLQVAAYYLSAALVNGPEGLATPQPDTLLYCQAARRIVEGHAFSFSEGTPVSTGTTSVLYPFVLAVPYALGFTGGLLLTAGFWLNAVCYLIFLGGWAVAFRKWLPQKVAFFATLLLAVAPQPAFSAFSQSDTGLWMAVSGLMSAALASERRWVYAALLCLGPWVRPEGALVILSFVAVVIFLRRWRDAGVAVLSLFSMVGVFAFNRYLTGVGGFSSVAAKGFFTTLPIAEALRETTVAAVSMANDLLFGRASSFPRGLYAIPLVGAVVFWIGAGRFGWSRRIWTVPVLCLAALGGFAVIAQSGWQGTNTDRYLAWLMPLIVCFSAVGWCWCRERLSAFCWSRFLLAVPIGYSIFAGVALLGNYHLCCQVTERPVRFAQEVDRLIPANASVATLHYSGLAYWLGDRHVANLSGIYSPEYNTTYNTTRDVCELFELFKRESEKRLDYWLAFANDDFPEEVVKVCTKPVVSGPDGSVLRKMDWSTFDRAKEDPAVEGKTLKCRVDVGYRPDETRTHFEIVSCYGMRPFKPLIIAAELDGREIVECGRLVVGYSELDVDGLVPDRDVTVVLRLCDQVKAFSMDDFGMVTKAEYTFTGENGFHIAVDGREVTCAHLHIEKRGFSDLTLKIPGKHITASRHRLKFHGDHAAFGYWFFQ